MLVDGHGRGVTYLRLSVTDRCDLRCVYCMAEDMQFLPKPEVLSLEELGRVAETFIRLGVRKIRLTGGEPLARRNVMSLIDSLGAHVRSGALDELTLTTNGTQLHRLAGDLAAAGIRRINVSLDTLNPDTFQRLTRRGNLAQVLEGLDVARQAGLQVKINAVALHGVNSDEFDHLIQWCGRMGFDLCLIETMPLGEVDTDRSGQYLPLAQVEQDLSTRWTLTPSDYRTGGPARYVHIGETGGRLGLITPLSHNFCDSCNRVRVTCTGTLYTCLGHEDQTDLRAPLRGSEANHDLEQAILAGLAAKPKGHDFAIGPGLAPATRRHMSTTGG